MPVHFKGVSEYRSKFKGGRTHSKHRMQVAGLRSDQLGITREPQFHYKKPAWFRRPQVSRSLQWEGSQGQTYVRESHRPGITPSSHTPLAPRGPASTGANGEASALTPPKESEEQQTPCAATSVEKSGAAGRSESAVEHSLKKRAGLKTAQRRSNHQISEYQRQFMWKHPAVKSPLLAAEQMVYNSNRVIPPFKSVPLVLESEYRRNFKGSSAPRGPRLRHVEELIQQENISPQKEANSKRKQKQQHGGERPAQEVTSQPHKAKPAYRKVRSEYSSSFRSPLHYRYQDGVWRKASSAHHDIQELRERAASYRRRAWGTHFSRDHLNQILSEQNRLWEASTDASSTCTHGSGSIISTLDLARCESHRERVSGSSPASIQSLGKKPEEETLPVERKLAWEEEDRVAGPERQSSEEREEDGAHIQETAAVPCKSTSSASESLREEGRVPTPKLKTIAAIQRTHHDLTTPVAGGAILVSPPNLKGAKQASGRCKLESKRSHVPPQTELRQASPAAGLITADPIPMREELPQSSPVYSSNKHSAPILPPAACALPANRIHGTLRAPEFQHNGNLGLWRPEASDLPSSERAASDNDDRMSHISSLSAASGSLASRVLERAQHRRDHFWAKR